MDEEHHGGSRGLDRTVLLVDDDVLFCRAVTRVLRGRFSVVVVHSIGQAMTALREQDPIAILADMSIGNESGITLLQAIESEMPTAVARFAFVTGSAVNDAAGQTMRESGRPCLAKPFSCDELVALIEQLACEQAEEPQAQSAGIDRGG